MRTYIFTATEKEILKAWFNEDVKLANINVLIYRIKKAQTQIKEDYKLLLEALKRI